MTDHLTNARRKKYLPLKKHIFMNIIICIIIILIMLKKYEQNDIYMRISIKNLYIYTHQSKFMAKN